MRKISVCIPLSWKFVPVDFFHSFIAMMAYEQDKSEIQLVDETSCYLDENRNAGIKKAMAWGAEYILTLDADQAYPADTISRLCAGIDSGKSMVGGVTNSRHNRNPLVYLYTGKGMQQQSKLPKTGYFQCSAMGLGGIMFKADVFNQLKYPWFRTGYIDNVDGYVGEDIYFFKRCLDEKINLYADCSLKYGHLLTICI